jgi:hypothetical protein
LFERTRKPTFFFAEAKIRSNEFLLPTSSRSDGFVRPIVVAVRTGSCVLSSSREKICGRGPAQINFFSSAKFVKMAAGNAGTTPFFLLCKIPGHKTATAATYYQPGEGKTQYDVHSDLQKFVFSQMLRCKASAPQEFLAWKAAIGCLHDYYGDMGGKLVLQTDTVRSEYVVDYEGSISFAISREKKELVNVEKRL